VYTDDAIKVQHVTKQRPFAIDPTHISSGDRTGRPAHQERIIVCFEALQQHV